MHESDSDAWDWYAHCPNGHGLAPAAEVSLSASRSMRIYVCSYDGIVIIRFSDGSRSLYMPEYFAKQMAASQRRLSDGSESNGDR